MVKSSVTVKTLTPSLCYQGVCLVVGITSKAMLLQTLTKRRSTVLFTLGQLTVSDRREIVQKGLDSFGKKLSDSAFNNQVLTSISFLILLSGFLFCLFMFSSKTFCVAPAPDTDNEERSSESSLPALGL